MFASRRAALVAVAVLVAATARDAWATISLTATLPSATTPLANALTAYGTSSTLSVTVTNNGNQAVHQIDFQMPLNTYSASGGTAPSGIWTVTTPRYLSPAAVRFTSKCSSTGLAAGASATFVINLTTPQGDTPTDTTTSNFTVTGSSTGSGSGCGTTTTGTTTFTAPVKALYITGIAAPTYGLGVPMTGIVTWTVTNKSSATQTSITVIPVVSPTSGASGKCNNISSLASQSSGTITCTYTITASGTYTFTANASNGASTATAVGASAGSITVGTSSVTWSKYAIAYGRESPYTLKLKVTNASQTTITGVDVINAAPANWTLSTFGSSSTNGLATVSGSSADVAFSGTALAAGASTTLTIAFSAVPTVTTTTSYTFTVKLTPAAGSTYAMTTTQAVVLVVPIKDVSGLTILASSKGQALAWTNTSANGSTHDGVVIFRTASGAAPGTPTDFTAYTAGAGNVVYADSGSSSVSTYTDSTVGSYNYRVCNHDAYNVYSSCSTGFWNSAGYLDSETYPSGGWVHAVGGDARLKPGLLSGNRVGVASNIPSVAVLDTATGARSFAPVTIASLPSATTPAVTLANGKVILFAADQSGNITAINLATGDVYWQVTKTGEKFTAGVSGITRAAASAAFQAAYQMDILLLGSTTGTVYAIDTTTGATLWTLSAGKGVYGLITYDPLTDICYVPTAGLGVMAYSLAASSPTVKAVLASAWTNPEASGDYRLACVRTAASAGIACVNSSGVLRVMDKTTGALQATALSTGISAPTALVRVSGSAATAGLVVANASSLKVLSATGSPYAITLLGTWTPGMTISTPSVYADSGYLVVGGSDKRLHRVLLSNATQAAQSPVVTTQATSLLTGQPVFDTTSSLYIFGTSDGHVWALPSF